MSEVSDKGKEVGENAEAGAGDEKPKSIARKEKIEAVKEKIKVAWSEVKTNFRANEGTTGYRKIQSMFVNLWKSGTTGKAVLIAGAVFLLLLPCVLGTSKVGRVVQLENETQEMMLQLCELDDLLGHKDMMSPWSAGRSLKVTDEAEAEKEMKNASSKELNLAITMLENMRKELNEELEKKRAECKKNGIEIDDVSPLRLAKEFMLCLRAKDEGGMKKLMYGDDVEETIKWILKVVGNAKKGEVEKLDELESLGQTVFNSKRDRAGVAIQDESKAWRSITGGSNCQCLNLIKKDGHWFVDAKKPFETSVKITNPLLSF